MTTKQIKGSKLDLNGYKIPLKNIDKLLLNKIENELHVMPNGGFIEADETSKYKVYIKDEKYISIPRYYGIEKFGEPKKIKFKENKINIEFTGKLRDYQIDIINKSLIHIKKYGGGLISVPCGMGKCLGLNTKIIMYNGEIKNVQDIIIGDIIMGDDSTCRNILSICRGNEKMYKISDLETQESYTVNESHILSLKIKEGYIIINRICYTPLNILDISVKNYLELDDKIKNKLFGYRVPIKFDKTICKNDIKYDLPIKKYEFLREMFDKYGKMYNDEIYFITKDINLCKNIVFVSRSLGYNCFNINNIIKIWGNNLHIIINNSWITYKADEIICKEFDFTSLLYKINVCDIGNDDYYGFEIDGNKRFVLEDFTVTHNTTMAINIASQLGLKTLVITHKSFLQDQWVDRCKQFTKSEVGTIRQNKVDVEGKDFVIGMIQSIGKRDYDPKIFKDFGLVIADEAHHFSSKHFSRALFKLGTKYTIGLSATPYRNDGLMKITNWFLGNIMYQIKIRTNNQVIAKVLNFISDDKLFGEKKRFMKGEVRADCVKMVSNIIAMKDRNQHIINIINELRKDPDRKILILSDRKAHLKFLKESIDVFLETDIKENKILKDECKTYYYTGDLKQAERIDAEKNADILFATYNMAHEGLDIDRLNCIILATPKKDVVQAVGRIMRKILQDGDIRPLIIDIIDNFSIFPGQFKKRETFYKKSEYIIDNYYLCNNKIISSTEYSRLTGKDIKNTNNFNKYSEILQVPPVEIIKTDDDSDNLKDVKKDLIKNSKNKTKKNKDDDSDKSHSSFGLGLNIFGKK